MWVKGRESRVKGRESRVESQGVRVEVPVIKEEAPAGMRRPLVVYIEEASIFFNKTIIMSSGNISIPLPTKLPILWDCGNREKSSNFASCFENE